MAIYFKDEKPFIEKVCLNNITDLIQTPFYVYSQQAITEAYHKLRKLLDTEIYFSVKANSNQAILSLMKSLGAGADVVSSGELERALCARFNPKKINTQNSVMSSTYTRMTYTCNNKRLGSSSNSFIRTKNKIDSRPSTTR